MNSKERFSSRVDTYTKYRPSYPAEAIDYLYGTVGLSEASEVLDVGAGTGIFSRLLLERGSGVTAVEPNEAMREAALAASRDNPRFKAVPGSAEETGLSDASYDFIVCAQAFHWFDRTAAQREFHRVLKPGGKAILVWNTRLTEGTPFLEGYERLLQGLGTDYGQVNHRNISREALIDFFKPDGMTEARFRNRQVFDFDGVAGRLLSSSYSPQPGQPGHEPMMQELRDLFERCQENGTVNFDYVTEIYWGEV
ncbi:SAM-dependent methyltransferase [Cohnella sp. CIP 111063]|uniref:class I SAM-dependent methyltransferase n=1 Tax=unclassified Cohnella TaxID=2636738 RepID=UPI000B8C2CD3|nr:MULTISPECIES: class I SAM-dependent methyltransferase [unclassified Cohnella]OXS58862.1 SAM-dependent methyltransferase [Cohnella sp. CIP 111063]PRX71952.1 methyltransferase family protein [Cohnella sp. SGD-V74]